MNCVKRSCELLTEDDLRRLVALSLARLNDVFESAPVADLYRDRLILLALCQGAAQHYIDGTNGLKDLDVWAFFKKGPSKPFPFRTIWHADFGPSHLGRDPTEGGYIGRRIDILGRSIHFDHGDSEEKAVLRWVTGGGSSPSHIVKRPVIGLFPGRLFAEQIWLPKAVPA